MISRLLCQTSVMADVDLRLLYAFGCLPVMYVVCSASAWHNHVQRQLFFAFSSYELILFLCLIRKQYAGLVGLIASSSTYKHIFV